MSESKIIIINGTSSAGKSSLAKAIQNLAIEPFQIVSLDQYRDGLPDKFRGLNTDEASPGARGLNVVATRQNGRTLTTIQFGDYGRQILTGMRQSIATLASLGVNVIVDDMVNYRLAAAQYAEFCQPFQTTVVGVHCDLNELYRREQTREGRFPGTAEGQLELVHQWMHYDIEIDTTKITIHDEAEIVLSQLTKQPHSRAIDRMASELLN